MVEITEERYDELVRADNILGALYAAGVDNWEGFEIALESLED